MGTSPPCPVSTIMGDCMVDVRGTAPILSASLLGFFFSISAPASPVGLRALFSTSAISATEVRDNQNLKNNHRISLAPTNSRKRTCHLENRSEIPSPHGHGTA